MSTTDTIRQAVVRPATAKSAILWVLQIAVAFMLGMAGWLKLTGNPMQVQVFGTIGLGQWFRYLTGGLEVIAAVGLLVPKLSGYAGLLAATVMFGAVAAHLFVLGGSPLTALALMVASLLIAWGRLGRKSQ